MPSGSGSIAGGATATPMAQRGGHASGFTPAHQPLHRAGDAGRHDLGTTPRLRRTRNLHIVSANAWRMLWATLGLCNGAGRLPQVASDEIRWRQASWPNFINWANSVLLSPRGTGHFSSTQYRASPHVIGLSNGGLPTSTTNRGAKCRSRSSDESETERVRRKKADAFMALACKRHSS
jgi:hypothetical protein